MLVPNAGGFCQGGGVSPPSPKLKVIDAGDYHDGAAAAMSAKREIQVTRTHWRMMPRRPKETAAGKSAHSTMSAHLKTFKDSKRGGRDTGVGQQIKDGCKSVVERIGKLWGTQSTDADARGLSLGMQAWKVHQRYLANDFQNKPALTGIIVRRLLSHGGDTTVKDKLIKLNSLLAKVDDNHRLHAAQMKKLQDSLKLKADK